jgi:hypothetical protein
VFDLYQYKADMYAQMNAWKLIPQPERFTELYFNDSANLPSQVSKGGKVSFSFVIHNLEGKSWDYQYAVYFKFSDGHVINIAQNVVALADGGYKTVNGSYISESDNGGGIFVELKNPEQHIDFLVNN